MKASSETGIPALDLPLRGASLIEASAGTGKTWTLATLFLRLVLEGEAATSPLLLTFSENATAELRQRLGQRLGWALALLEGTLPPADAEKDPVLAKWLSRRPDEEGDRERLRRALVDLDRLSVFTIHGFCHRLLGEFGYSLDFPPEAEQIAEEEALGRALQGLLSREWARLPAFMLRWIEKRGPRSFETELKQRQRLPEARLVLPDGRADAQAWIDSAQELPAAWQELRRQAEGWDADWDKPLRESKKRYPGALHGSTLNARLRKLDGMLARPAPPSPRIFEQEAGMYHPDSFGTIWRRDKLDAPPAVEALGRYAALNQPAARLQDAFERRLKEAVLTDLPRQVAKERQARGQFSFNDLIQRALAAVKGEHGTRIAALLRRRHTAVLVDEFQDTDPLQYDLLRRLFPPTAERLLVYVGDPKQAIYRFRGGDVHTWAIARRDLEEAGGRQLPLTRCFRSDGALVQVFNRLFAAPRRVFGEGAALPAPLDVPPARAGSRAPAGEALVCHLLPEDLWDGNPGTALEHCLQDCARRLREACSAEPGLERSRLAVLVRSNEHARRMVEALAAEGLPARRLLRDSIFDDELALALLQLLSAMADPADAAMLAGLLAGPLSPLPGTALFAEEDRGLDAVRAALAQAAASWAVHGPGQALPPLLETLDTRRALLGAEHGEARLGLFRQLLDELLGLSREHPSPDALLHAWRARIEEAGEQDPAPLPESDEQRISVLTVHSSKGLEYERVFCPVLFGDLVRLKGAAERPDGEGGRLLIPDPDESTKAAWREDLFLDSMRLCYVALTRARCQVQLWLGPANGGKAGISALGSLLQNDPREPLAPDALKAVLAKRSRAQWITALETVRGEDLARHFVLGLQAAAAAPALAASSSGTWRAAALPRGRGRSFRVGSFSSLWHAKASGSEHDEDFLVEGVQESADGLPAGAAFGTVIHELLEELDFSSLAPEAAERLQAEEDLLKACRRGLAAAGMDPQLATRLQPLLLKALRCRFPERSGIPRLCSLNPADCRSELDFLLPLQGFEASRLVPLLREHGWPAELPPDLRLSGFLRGFIDLVYYAEGRWHILDWKSNRLEPGGYGPEELEAAMLAHGYPLQALCYALALYRWLRLGGIDPEQGLGSVSYFFLRGVDKESRGIWNRPLPVDLLAALDKEVGLS